MAEYVCRRNTASANIHRYLRISGEFKIATTKREEVNVRMKRLDGFLHEFEKYQALIDEETDEEHMPAEVSMRETTDEAYIAAMANFTSISILHSPIETNTQLDTNQRSNQIKLPPINLPTFSGQYKDWSSFSNLFKTLIETNDHLSKCQKFHYLKSSLTGEAEQLLNNYNITDENYNEAWARLEERYNNNSFIVDSHLDTLFNLPKLTFESVVKLRSLRDKADQTVTALNSLGLPTEHWDSILVYLMATKLDEESHRQWSLTRSRASLPTFKDIITFLDTRWQSLESVPDWNNSMDTTAKPKNQNLVSTHFGQISRASSVCNYCNEEHYLNQCKTFLEQSYAHKTEFVKTNNLCFNSQVTWSLKGLLKCV